MTICDRLSNTSHIDPQTKQDIMNIINIFQSLFELILSYNDVELDAFNAVIQEIKTIYAKCLLKEELGVTAPTSIQPQINLLPNLTK